MIGGGVRVGEGATLTAMTALHRPFAQNHDADTLTEPITVRDALASGATPGVLRGPAWSRPIHGVRMPPQRGGGSERVRALAVVVKPGVAFAHVTALRLLGVEVPWRLAGDDRIHTVATSRQDRAQRVGVVAHHSTQDRLEVTVKHGLTVTTPAQTWVHLASDLRSGELVVLADAMMRRQGAMTTVAELRRIALGTRKVKGIVAARACLERVRPGTDSSMETRARLVLVDAGLPCPEVNRAIIDNAGQFVAMPDMSYPAARIAIEYDGDIHRTDRSAWRRDVRRFRAIEDLGWTVVRVIADDVVRDSSEFVSRVRRALRQAYGPAGMSR